MVVKVDEENLKQGLLGLVVAVVEILQEALEIQSIKRIESGALDEKEIERLGRALLDLDEAIENIKEDNNLEKIVESIIDGLDEVVDDTLDKFINPDRWVEMHGHEQSKNGKVPVLNRQGQH